VISNNAGGAEVYAPMSIFAAELTDELGDQRRVACFHAR